MKDKVFCGFSGVNLPGKDGSAGDSGCNIYTSYVNPSNNAAFKDVYVTSGIGDYVYAPSGIYKKIKSTHTYWDTSITNKEFNPADDYLLISSGLRFTNKNSYIIFDDPLVKKLLLATTTGFHDATVSGNEITYAEAQALQNADTSINVFKDTSIFSFKELKSFTNENFTTIPDNFFKDCSYLTTISIPSQITTIGNHAFDGCFSLSDTNLFDKTISSIGDYCFKDCSALSTFNYNTTLTSFPPYSFSGCGFTSLTLPTTLTDISTGAFSNCKLLTDVVIDSYIEKVSPYCFYDCNKLKNVTVNSNINSIGDYAFAKTSITSIDTLDTSVFGVGCFSDCSVLSNINIGYSSPEKITLSTNEDTPNVIKNSSNAKFNVQSDKYYLCKDGVNWDSISDSSIVPYDEVLELYFQYYDVANPNTKLPMASTEATSPIVTINGTEYSTDSSGWIKFKNTDGTNKYFTKGTTISIVLNDYDSSSLVPINNTYNFPITAKSGFFQQPFTYVLDAIQFADPKVLAAFLATGTQYEGYYDKNKNGSISSKEAKLAQPTLVPIFDSYKTSVTSFNEFETYFTNMLSIGDSSTSAPFANMSALTSISIPKSIGSKDTYKKGLDYAFYNDSALTTISGSGIPKTTYLTSLDYTFYNTKLSSGLSIPDNITSMRYTYSHCSSINSTTIGANVTDIEKILSESGITAGPVIPSSVINANNAFENCSSLISAYLGTNVENMSNYCSGCNNLTTLNGSLSKAINMDSAFQNCLKLTAGPSIPSTAKNMNNTFKNCSSLGTAYIGSGAENMNETFHNCTALTTLNGTLSAIGDLNYTFANTKLVTGPTVPTRVTDMTYTFADSSYLTTANIGNGTVVTASHTFENATSLSSVTGTFSSSMTGMDYTFKNSGITISPAMPNSVIALNHTFEDCSKLETVYIGTGVTSFINAFDNCRSIKYINGSTNNSFDCNSIADISSLFNDCAFVTCPKITSTNVKYMDETFMDCSKMTTGCIGQGVINSSDGKGLYHTFMNDVSLSSLDTSYGIPTNTGLTTLWGTFDNCGFTTAIPTIPSNITKLVETFKDCSLMTAITLSANDVSLIGTFSGCKKATKLDVSANKIVCDSSAFKDCSLFGTVRLKVADISLNNSLSNKTTIADVSITTNDISLGNVEFSGCSGIKTIELTSNTARLNSTFNTLPALTTVDISTNTLNATSIFNGCNKLSSLDVSINNISIDGSVLTDSSNVALRLFSNSDVSIGSAFAGTKAIKTLDISTNALSLTNTFKDCSSLSTLTIKATNVSLNNTFINCTNIIDASLFANNVSMSGAFNACSSLNIIDVSVKNISLDNTVFSNCTKLKKVNLYDIDSPNFIINPSTFIDSSNDTSIFVNLDYITNYRNTYGTDKGYNLTDNNFWPFDEIWVLNFYYFNYIWLLYHYHSKMNRNYDEIDIQGINWYYDINISGTYYNTTENTTIAKTFSKIKSYGHLIDNSTNTYPIIRYGDYIKLDNWSNGIYTSSTSYTSTIGSKTVTQTSYSTIDCSSTFVNNIISQPILTANGDSSTDNLSVSSTSESANNYAYMAYNNNASTYLSMSFASSTASQTYTIHKNYSSMVAGIFIKLSTGKNGNIHITTNHNNSSGNAFLNSGTTEWFYFNINEEISQGDIILTFTSPKSGYIYPFSIYLNEVFLLESNI